MTDKRLARLITFAAVMCAMSLVCGGCRPSTAAADAHDRAGPAFERAVALEQVGRLDDAIEAYEKILLDNPRKFAVHLHLALLLHDYRQDYIGAIYHYKRYMAERAGGEKDDMVSKRIRLAEQLLAAQYGRQGDDSQGTLRGQMAQEIDKLNARITALEGEKSAAVAEREKMARELQAAQAETQRLRRLVDNLRMVDGEAPQERSKGSVLNRIMSRREVESAPAEPAKLPSLGSEAIAAARAEVDRLTATEAAPGADAPAASRPAGGAGAPAANEAARGGMLLRTYVVQPGDTLFRIAERHYGDGAQWWRIRDANRKRIGVDGQVRSGQVLVIP